MAESISHRFSEYLRNNQPSEEMDASSNAVYDASHETVQLGKTVDTERCRTQEKRSSITRYDISRLFLISSKPTANKNNCFK